MIKKFSVKKFKKKICVKKNLVHKRGFVTIILSDVDFELDVTENVFLSITSEN